MTKVEDHELETWREQWRSMSTASPAIHRKIKRQNFWFVVSNLVAVVGAMGALIFAAWAVRQEPSRLRIAWAIGILVLVFVCAGYRLWSQRGTWRPETQSTRAFVELWQKRVMSKLRVVRIAFYLIPGWVVFCAILAATNWSVCGPDMRAHPTDWLETLAIIVAMLTASFLWLAWYRRWKLRELAEAKRMLDEMRD